MVGWILASSQLYSTGLLKYEGYVDEIVLRERFPSNDGTTLQYNLVTYRIHGGNCPHKILCQMTFKILIHCLNIYCRVIRCTVSLMSKFVYYCLRHAFEGCKYWLTSTGNILECTCTHCTWYTLQHVYHKLVESMVWQLIVIWSTLYNHRF